MKNRNVIKTLAMVTVVGTLMGTTGLTAHAADNVGQFDGTAAKMISQVFDAEYYAETYPDVAAALGTDETALLTHYLTLGIYEGRDASAEFNADAYASANADLVAVYNSEDTALEYTNYIFHYLNCGKTEGRVSTVADATNAGFTVVSATDDTKVLAQPATAINNGRNYSATTGGSSSSGSASTSSSASYSAPASNDSASSSSYSAPADNTVSTPAYVPGGEVWDGNPGAGSDYSDAATIDRNNSSDCSDLVAELDWD